MASPPSPCPSVGCAPARPLFWRVACDSGCEFAFVVSGPYEFHNKLGLLSGQPVFLVCVVHQGGAPLLAPLATRLSNHVTTTPMHWLWRLSRWRAASTLAPDRAVALVDFGGSTILSIARHPSMGSGFRGRIASSGTVGRHRVDGQCCSAASAIQWSSSLPVPPAACTAIPVHRVISYRATSPASASGGTVPLPAIAGICREGRSMPRPAISPRSPGRVLNLALQSLSERGFLVAEGCVHARQDGRCPWRWSGRRGWRLRIPVPKAHEGKLDGLISIENRCRKAVYALVGRRTPHGY